MIGLHGVFVDFIGSYRVRRAFQDCIEIYRSCRDMWGYIRLHRIGGPAVPCRPGCPESFRVRLPRDIISVDLEILHGYVGDIQLYLGRYGDILGSRAGVGMEKPTQKKRGNDTATGI